jgi:hypothetical protein
VSVPTSAILRLSYEWQVIPGDFWASVRNFLDPDIPETDGVAVILEGDGAFV